MPGSSFQLALHKYKEVEEKMKSKCRNAIPGTRFSDDAIAASAIANRTQRGLPATGAPTAQKTPWANHSTKSNAQPLRINQAALTYTMALGFCYHVPNQSMRWLIRKGPCSLIPAWMAWVTNASTSDSHRMIATNFAWAWKAERCYLSRSFSSSRELTAIWSMMSTPNW